MCTWTQDNLAVIFVLFEILNNSFDNEDAGHMPSTGNIVPYTPLAEKPPAELKSSQASVIQLCHMRLAFLIRGILKISHEFFLQLNAFW